MVIACTGFIAGGLGFGRYLDEATRATHVQRAVFLVARVYSQPVHTTFEFLHDSKTVDIFFTPFVEVEIADVKLGPLINLFYILPYAVATWLISHFISLRAPKTLQAHEASNSKEAPTKERRKGWERRKLALVAISAVFPLAALADRMLDHPRLPENIDRIVVSGKPLRSKQLSDHEGSVEFVDSGLIAEVIRAIECASRDLSHRCLRSCVIQLFHGKELVVSLSGTGTLDRFDIDGVRYRDRTRLLQRLLVSPLRAGTTLVGDWSLDRRRWAFGEAITGKYRLLNAGSDVTRIPERVMVNIKWYRKHVRHGIKMWGSNEQMVVKVASEVAQGADNIFRLESGASATYEFAFPSEKLGKRKVQLQLSFEIPEEVEDRESLALPISSYYDLRFITIK